MTADGLPADLPVAQTASEALESQRRWLSIAAMEPDPDARAEALERASREGNRAVDLALEAADDFDQAMREVNAAAKATPGDFQALQDRLLERANPHPPGSFAGEWWLLARRVEGLFAPAWDWLEDRPVNQLVGAIVVVFLILVALSAAAGSWVPLGLGIVFWFVGGWFVRRNTKGSP